MKKYFLFLLILFCVPTVGMGADSCTNPKEYTIDKRCYVTDVKKPFDSVVYLVSIVGNYCSGVMINGDDGKKYIYTATHCVLPDDKPIERISKNITAKTFSGRTMTAKFDKVIGDGQVALYVIDKKGLSLAEIGKKNALEKDIHVVGYGNFEILSDETIKKFKAEYIDYLSREKSIYANGDEYQYGFVSDGGIIYNSDRKKEYYYNDYIKDFWNFLYINNQELYDSIFGDPKLKMSTCKYYGNYSFDGCQVVRGDSGGGVFDENGNVIGIILKAEHVIGGSLNMKLTLISNIQNK